MTAKRETKLNCVLELPTLCDICKKPRNQGKHYSCSRIRQKMHQKKVDADEQNPRVQLRPIDEPAYI